VSTDAIRDFIVNNLKFRGSPEELTGSYPLIDREAIDSMGIFQLVGFLEDEFGVEVGDEDLVVDNFASIDAINQLVERKRGQ
jgi:acyl carrier protein